MWGGENLVAGRLYLVLRAVKNVPPTDRAVHFCKLFFDLRTLINGDHSKRDGALLAKDLANPLPAEAFRVVSSSHFGGKDTAWNIAKLASSDQRGSLKSALSLTNVKPHCIGCHWAASAGAVIW